MKRFIVSLAIMGVIVALAVTGIIYTFNSCDDITAILNEAKHSAENEDFEKAKAKSHEAAELFEKRERLMTVFANHDHIEQVELEISCLPDYATKATKEVFLASLSEVEMALWQLKNAQLPVLDGVF